MKKFLCTLLALTVILSVLPACASAKSETVTLYGNTYPADTTRLCIIPADSRDANFSMIFYAEEYALFKRFCFVGTDSYYKPINLNEIVKKFPKLEKLAVIGCDVKNVSALGKLKNLNYLKLDGNDGAEDISFVKNLTGLKTFLYRNWDCTDASPAAGLTNLTELALDLKFSEFTDISAVKNLKKLKKLTLSGSFKDISPLSGLTELRELDLETDSVRDISPLKKLPKLASLTLRRADMISCAEIAKLKNLRHIGFEYMLITDYEKLADMKNIRSMYVNGIHGLNEQQYKKFISQMTKLEKLNLDMDFWPSPFRGSLEDVCLTECGFIGGLKNLKELCISGLELNDISALKNLTELTRLEISWSNLTDVSALKYLKKLTRLHLSSNSISKVDITPIKYLTDLEYLEVNGLAIKDPSPILKLKKLNTVFALNTCIDKSFADKYAKINPKCKIFI